MIFGKYVKSFLTLVGFATMGMVLLLYPQASNAKTLSFEFQTIQNDSTDKDSLDNVPYTPSRRPTYRPKDRFGDPFSSRSSTSPLLLDEV
mgnify:CR=1 FL=1